MLSHKQFFCRYNLHIKIFICQFVVALSAISSFYCEVRLRGEYSVKKKIKKIINHHALLTFY